MKNKNRWCIIVLIIFISIILINRVPLIVYILKNNLANVVENTQKPELNTIQVDETTQKSEKFSKNNNISFNSLEESSLLTTGLEIIGLAIAVWTGVSIINAVEKREVEEMKEELSDIINHMENKNKNEFLLELLKTDKDEMSRYYYRKFKEENAPFSELITVEHMFNEIYSMHSNGSMSKEQIIKETEELENIIEEILENDNKKSKKVKTRLVIDYLKFRKAEGLFYRGYALMDKKEYEQAYKTYDDATKIYLEIMCNFNIKFPKYEDISMLDENFWTKKVHKYYNDYELFAYWANTIGEAYGNMVLAVIKNKKDTAEEVAKKAVFYSKLAVNCAEMYDINKNVYYKNLACNYERRECTQSKAPCFESKEALEYYKKTFDLTINQPQLSKEQIGKVYYTYLAYANKYIRNKLNLDFKKSEIIPKNELDNLKVSSDTIAYIDEMNKIASIAIIDDIRKSSNIVMYGFVNGYIALLKQIKNKEYKVNTADKEENAYIDKIFIKDKDYYLKEMKWSKDTLELMNIHDAYYDELIKLSEIF